MFLESEISDSNLRVETFQKLQVIEGIFRAAGQRKAKKGED